MLLGGWQSVSDEWYYFHKTTYVGLNGKHYADNGIQFTFENGRLTSGVWVTTSAGTRYWYGPGYYRDSSTDGTSSKPFLIEGKTYLFNQSGYMQTGIVGYFAANVTIYYDCGTNGVATILNGPVGDHFYKDGVLQKKYRLVEYEGDFYFIDEGDKLIRSKRIYLSAVFVAGFTFEDGTAIPVGYYEFDAEGRMIVKNGPDGDYFYKNGIRQKKYQLVEYKGEFYFIDEGDKLLKNIRIYLSNAFVKGKTFADGTPIPAGYYTFDAEGRMIQPESVQPHVHTEVTDPAKAPTCTETGLTEGKHCSVCGEVLAAQTAVAAKGHTPGVWITVEAPAVGAEGKRQQLCEDCGQTLSTETIPALPAGKNGPVGDYFYKNDVRLKKYQLVEFEGNFYFIDEGDKLLKNIRVYLSSAFVSGKTFPNGKAIQPGYYEFDAEGKMVLPDARHGVVGDYLYINGV